MNNPIIHTVPDLVDVIWRADLEAVNLKWHSEYDEGTAVRDAVRAAVDYVNANSVRNWLADISHSREALRDADLAWVNGDEFQNMIRNSSLERFVMIPPLPQTGQDTGWLDDWEQNTLRAFGAGTKAKLTHDINEIRAFFGVDQSGD